jgi:LysM repeat protein
MTRETKIGLLVGLAFVIVIGILISDHLSSTNEPSGAPLRLAADNVRSSLGQQGSDDLAPPLRAPTLISPQQQIVTTDELNHRNSGPPVVFVNPQQQPRPPMQSSNANGNIPDRLRDIARSNGEDIIPPGGDSTYGGTNPNGSNNTQPLQQQPAPKTVARTYEAQAGDSLGAIALKEMGSSCKANRDAIVAANPGLADNRDLIIVGKTYIIPAAKGAASNGSASMARTPVAPTKPADTNPPTTVTYLVKAHDTLWSIANDEIGSAAAVDTIRQLNQDVLNGNDRLRPNMKLRLPAHTAVDRSNVTRND